MATSSSMGSSHPPKPPISSPQPSAQPRVRAQGPGCTRVSWGSSSPRTVPGTTSGACSTRCTPRLGSPYSCSGTRGTLCAERQRRSWGARTSTCRWVGCLGSPTRERPSDFGLIKEKTELFNILVHPLRSDFALCWHRDDIRNSADENEERTLLEVRHYGVCESSSLFSARGARRS